MFVGSLLPYKEGAMDGYRKEEETRIRITLEPGRDNMSANYSDDTCGSWETNTNNHGEATCC